MVQDDKFTIPGENPLNVRSPATEVEATMETDFIQYCADPKDYILQIDHVNLTPNPPRP